MLGPGPERVPGKRGFLDIVIFKYDFHIEIIILKFTLNS